MSRFSISYEKVDLPEIPYERVIINEKSAAYLVPPSPKNGEQWYLCWNDLDDPNGEHARSFSNRETAIVFVGMHAEAIYDGVMVV